MHVFSWLDDRTLLASQCVLVGVFSAILFGLHSLHPGIRGVKAIAIGFVLSVPGVVLIATAGAIPLSTAVPGGATFLLFPSILRYRGILQFCRSRQPPLLRRGVRATKWEARDFTKTLLGGFTVVIVLLFYFTAIKLNPSACAMLIWLALAAVRSLMASNLLRAANGRVHMSLLGGSMAILAVFGVLRCISAIFVPVPVDFLQRNSSETLEMLVALVFLCIEGVLFLLMFASDVTETVHEQAQIDHLTGALNRRGIEAALEVELERNRRSVGGSFAILLIDIDHFKSINDLHGHAAGDESLRAVVRAINRTVRGYDRLGRFGGDEFLLLLPQATAEDAMTTAARIREAVNEDAVGRSLTVSIGAAVSGPDETLSELVDLLSRADTAMYEAKQSGRDCCRLARTGMTPDEHRSRIADLVAASARNAGRPRAIAREM